MRRLVLAAALLCALTACDSPAPQAYDCSMDMRHCVPIPATPTPPPDPNNSYRGRYDNQPPEYLGTVDGCRVFRLNDIYTVYMAHCVDGHGSMMYHTGGKGSHPVQTL